MFDKILLPLDGSSLAERALPLAAKLARENEATLILLRSVALDKILIPDAHAMGGYSPLWPTQSLRLARKEALDYITRIQKTEIPHNVSVRTEVIEGEPADGIVDVARVEGATLIVLSSHGYSGATRWILGSVAERVLHGAPCPVLIVRTIKPIAHMLIALDGSPLSEQVLEPAFAVAAALQCKVTLLRAVDQFSKAEYQNFEGLEHELGQRLIDNIQQTTEDYLNAIAKAHEASVPDIRTIVIHDRPAEAILDYGPTHDVDLIAMSTHGRTGLRRWLYGSVTEKVLRVANCCSMLIVRPEPHLTN